MRTDDPALFLSLRPRFAELLLSGAKSIELRRVRPAVHEGTPVLLYASSPAMKLVGRAEVAQVQVASVAEIWREHGPETGIRLNEYNDYFKNAKEAVAIKLVNIQRLDKPRPLQDLRDRLSGFQPPQSYRYLDKAQVAALV
ncbi:MAG TPA: ASCH domain-containing protein [Solirubrobacterales bacterium]|nr:ASCH domain-containing protein [Solirubrobacterales bacterium]